MKYFDWDENKNELLRLERDICFEDVQLAVEEGRVLVVIKHPNKSRYPNQQVMIVKIESYAYIVPFVEDNEKYFLKTIYPSRKMTKKYIIERRLK